MNGRFATFMGGWKGKAQLMKAQCVSLKVSGTKGLCKNKHSLH